MIEIKTVDEAAYITAVTSEIGEIARNDEGYICFRFENSHKVNRAHNGYGNEIELDDGYLLVDLTVYLKNIRRYNEQMKNFNK